MESAKLPRRDQKLLHPQTRGRQRKQVLDPSKVLVWELWQQSTSPGIRSVPRSWTLEYGDTWGREYYERRGNHTCPHIRLRTCLSRQHRQGNSIHISVRAKAFTKRHLWRKPNCVTTAPSAPRCSLCHGRRNEVSLSVSVLLVSNNQINYYLYDHYQ